MHNRSIVSILVNKLKFLEMKDTHDIIILKILDEYEGNMILKMKNMKISSTAYQTYDLDKSINQNSSIFK